MSSIVTVKWNIRAGGRHEGDVETVELTEYVQALINQKRVEVIERFDPAPVLGVVVVIEDLDAPVAALDADTGAVVPTPEEAMAATLTVPAPKPRPMRK